MDKICRSEDHTLGLQCGRCMQGVSVEVVRSLTSQDTRAVAKKSATAAVGGLGGRGHCKRQNGRGLATGWMWKKSIR